MKGLIIKDFITLGKKIRPVNRIIILIIMVASLIFLRSIGAFAISIMLPISVASFPISLLSCDAQCKWDKYAIALPVKKETIVGSRYIFCGLSLLCCSLFSVLLSIVVYLTLHEYSLGLHLGIVLAGLLIAMLYTIFILPANYLFGINGGSVVMLIFMLFVATSTFILQKQKLDFSLSAFLQLGTALIIAVVVLALIAISFAVSVKTYKIQHS